MVKTVPQLLIEIAELYKQRNELYGDNYKHYGSMMEALFPKGVTLKTRDDFNRFAIIVHMTTRISRYCMQFNNGGHKDSLDDTCNYSMMLQELDAMITERRKA